MKRIKLLLGAIAVCLYTNISAQITLSPIIDSTIPGLTENNIAIAEGRLRSIISSNGMVSGYGSKFIFACKIAALQREISGSKIIQHLEVTFAIGDNISNVCYGTSSVECIGIGNSEGQAMTSAIKNIKGDNPKLKKLVAESITRITDYYEQKGASIIATAKALLNGQKWEEALYELTAIPQEVSCYKQAAELMSEIYLSQLNHNAEQKLSEAKAIWSADPNPGPAAEQAMSILSNINTSATCYAQAQNLMKQIENRVKSVTEKKYKDNLALEKARIKTSAVLERARINACRDVAVAYAKRSVVVKKYYRYWW